MHIMQMFITCSLCIFMYHVDFVDYALCIFCVLCIFALHIMRLLHLAVHNLSVVDSLATCLSVGADHAGSHLSRLVSVARVTGYQTWRRIAELVG